MTYDPTIERIRQESDIVEVIGEVVRLRKAGAQYQGLCPFHADCKSPSFLVNPAKQVYHCHGCHASGDVFSFVSAIQNVPFQQARKILADRAGISLEEESREQREERMRVRREAEALAADCAWVFRRLERALWDFWYDVRALDREWTRWAAKQTDMEHPNWGWLPLIIELQHVADERYEAIARLQNLAPEIKFRVYLEWRKSHPRSPNHIAAEAERKQEEKHWNAFWGRFEPILRGGFLSALETIDSLYPDEDSRILDPQQRWVQVVRGAVTSAVRTHFEAHPEDCHPLLSWSLGALRKGLLPCPR